MSMSGSFAGKDSESPDFIDSKVVSGANGDSYHSTIDDKSINNGEDNVDFFRKKMQDKTVNSRSTDQFGDVDEGQDVSDTILREEAARLRRQSALEEGQDVSDTILREEAARLKRQSALDEGQDVSDTILREEAARLKRQSALDEGQDVWDTILREEAACLRRQSALDEGQDVSDTILREEAARLRFDNNSKDASDRINRAEKKRVTFMHDAYRTYSKSSNIRDFDFADFIRLTRLSSDPISDTESVEQKMDYSWRESFREAARNDNDFVYDENGEDISDMLACIKKATRARFHWSEKVSLDESVHCSGCLPVGNVKKFAKRLIGWSGSKLKKILFMRRSTHQAVTDHVSVSIIANNSVKNVLTIPANNLAKFQDKDGSFGLKNMTSFVDKSLTAEKGPSSSELNPNNPNLMLTQELNDAHGCSSTEVVDDTVSSACSTDS